MLEIIGLIAIGKWFNKTAKSHNMNAILWTIIGVGSYFVGAFGMGLVIGITNPQLLDQTLMLSLLGIIGGVIGALIAYGMFQSAIRKNINEDENDDLIDDDSTFYSQKDSDY